MALFEEITYSIIEALGGEGGVFEQFRAAAVATSSSSGGAWTGLSADARARLASQSRSQVHALGAAFSRARELIAAQRASAETAASFAAGVAAAQGEVARLRALARALPPPASGATPAQPPEAPQHAHPLQPLPLQPATSAPPAMRATLALEAYREALLRALAFLEAAAVGGAALPPGDVAGALDGVLEAALRGEAGLGAAAEGMASAESRAAREGTPLAAAVDTARGDARARVAAACARSRELDAALVGARAALAALRAAQTHPLHIGLVLSSAAALAGSGGGGGPADGALAGALTNRLRQQLAGRLPLGHSSAFPLPGALPPLQLRDLAGAAEAAAAEARRAAAAAEEAQRQCQRVEAEAGAGGRGGGEGLAAEAMGDGDEGAVGGGGGGAPPPRAPPPPPAPPLPVPPPLPPISAIIAGLTPAQRTVLRALLPPGWRPGEPLPPHLSDLRALLERAQGR
jgi:hypothetical protein